MSSIDDTLETSGARSARRVVLEWAVVAVPLACAYWFVAAALVAQWVNDPNYTHGLFVVPMSLILAWRRRKRLERTPVSPSHAGLLVLTAGGMLYLLGILAAELFTMRVSLVVAVFAVVLTMQGRGRTRALLFPLAFLLLMIPLPYVLYYKLTFPLQIKSSQLTAGLLSGLGMPVVRTGNIINLEGYTLEVVTACSGLRSLMTLGALAVFMTDFFKFGGWGNVLFVAASVPVAVVANTARLFLTAVVAAIAGSDAAESFFHGLSGVVVFLSGLALLFVAGILLEWMVKRRRAS
jgi:exosortase